MQQLLNIDIDGFIEIDLTGLPEGFLNPYGGQYNINLTNSATLEPVVFTAGDGKDYMDICLSFAQTITNLEDNFIVINIFNDNLPS